MRRSSMTAFEELRPPADAADPAARVSALDDLRRLYVGHYADLVRFAIRLTGDTTEAEDLVHTAFERLIARRLLVRDPVPFLYRVVVNLANDAWRRRRRDRNVVAALGAPDEVAPVDPSVADAIRRLPEPERTAIVLHYFADLTVADTAAVMKRPPGTVGRLLWSARARLSDELGDRDA